MKPEDVPQEWENVAWDAWNDGRRLGDVSAMRAILAAVAPLIAAKEREACAKVADARSSGPDRADGCNPVVVARDIAAAIRARGGDA